MWKLNPNFAGHAMYAMAQPLNPGAELITSNLGKYWKPADNSTWLVYSIKNVTGIATSARLDFGYAR